MSACVSQGEPQLVRKSRLAFHQHKSYKREQSKTEVHAPQGPWKVDANIHMRDPASLDYRFLV